MNAYLIDDTDDITQATVIEKTTNMPSYDIARQQASSTYKGIVIVNGTKVLRK